ncbi:MAG: hypothetical protein LBE09_08250 [Christensenellaceae bacterium]|jgi:hypothetical protein|nr:hypothetical protein [Christensenellaceae bacterium]
MAKKSKATGLTKGQTIAFCAFITLILSGIVWILSGFGVFGGARSALLFIKDLMLLFTIALAAHNFAKGLGKVWYVIYWIIVVIALIGIVFTAQFFTI